MNDKSTLLAAFGARVRAARNERQLSMRQLAENSGLSARFLADVEAGRGNIALGRMAQLAEALGRPMASLLDAPPEDAPAARIRSLLEGCDRDQRLRLLRLIESALGHQSKWVIALLGIRGAGKSTVGRRAAARMGLRFVELDERIEQAAGYPIGEIFEMHGEPYYRRLQNEALSALLSEPEPTIVALPGGIVSHPESQTLVAEACHSVWLKASPRDYWNRVIDQGDHRPMRARQNAMRELKQLVRSREALYRRADLTIDTSSLCVSEVVDQVVQALGALSNKT